MMKSSLTVHDIIKDIEFELMQESITSGDLAEGVRQVKQYQSQIRKQLFDEPESVSWEEVMGKQLQINDMLLLLLQEVVIGQRELARKFERFGKKQPSLKNLSAAELVEIFKQQDNTPSSFERRNTQNIKKVLSDTMQMRLEIQPSNVPIIGSWMNRIKIALHKLVLFYLNLFAKKQVTVNQTYGDWLLYLDSLNLQQQREITVLQTLVQEIGQKHSTQQTDTQK